MSPVTASASFACWLRTSSSLFASRSVISGVISSFVSSLFIILLQGYILIYTCKLFCRQESSVYHKNPAVAGFILQVSDGQKGLFVTSDSRHEFVQICKRLVYRALWRELYVVLIYVMTKCFWCVITHSCAQRSTF